MFRSVSLKRGLSFPSASLAGTSRHAFYKSNSSKSFIAVNNVRFNSTTPDVSEITSQLPSFSAEAEDAVKLTSDTIGYLESVGLPGNSFMGIFEHSLEYIHVYTGLPWWATIVMATVAFRAALVPLSIKATENMTRNAKAKPELDIVKAKINDPSNTLREKQLLQQQMFAILKKHGVKHRYALAPVALMSTSIGLFVSIREMCLLPVDGFKEQGAYWFQDLTASDPYALLPITSALIYAVTIRRGGESGEYTMPSAFKKIMTFMPIASIPFTMQLSAGVSLYLTTSAIFSGLQVLAFSNKSIRKFIGLSPKVKPLPSAAAKPEQGFKETITGFAEKMRENSEAKAKQFEAVNTAHNQAKMVRKSSANAYIRPVKRRK